LDPAPSQASLFDLPEASGLEPAGLAYRAEFITADEEQQLIELARSFPLAFAQYKQYTARRKVFSFGHSYDYDANELRDAPPVPAAFDFLRKRVAQWADVAPGDFVQLLIAEYAPGTPLGWHRDVPDYELVVGVSLGSAAVLRFRPYPHTPGRKATAREIEVAPRSVYALRGAARWEWQHSVPPTPGLRWSLTFRTRSGRRAAATAGPE
jgi:alkylated DNA repair dioxygenase AlkB